MTSFAIKSAAMADLVEVFVARAEARACLVRQGELDLHEAVDMLQAAAVQTGLVGVLGQSAVPSIMSRALVSVHERRSTSAFPIRFPSRHREFAPRQARSKP